MDDALFRAREKLNSITPLKRDCGRVCGSRCCDSLEGEETGMLLFPGEDMLYRDREGWTIRQTPAGPMVICPGTCSREDRPLARQGIRALDPEFAEAVREAGRMLAADGEQYRFLEVLTEEQDELKQLRDRLGGDSHV